MGLMTKDAFDALFGGWGLSELEDARDENANIDARLSSPLTEMDIAISPAMLAAGFQAYCEVDAHDATDWAKPAKFYRVYLVMERVRRAELELAKAPQS